MFAPLAFSNWQWSNGKFSNAANRSSILRMTGQIQEYMAAVGLKLDLSWLAKGDYDLEGILYQNGDADLRGMIPQAIPNRPNLKTFNRRHNP